MSELIFSSAASLARAIRTKQVSSTEVVQAFLDRIAEVQPKLNAVTHLASESALAEARAADEQLACGAAAGPLHGVPVSIKDAFDVTGMPAVSGTKGRAANIARGDAPAVARLKAAGAIVLGKTNTPELCLAYESDNLVYGRTNNPYDVTRTPGGSSGGEAALIAAGGSPLGLGSDAGGSIRVPAHFCGIAGLKPTTGRVPRTGHFPPAVGPAEALCAVGPLARYVEDLKLMLPIVSGPDWRDAAIVPLPVDDPDAVAVGRLRVAMHDDNGVATPTPETREAVRRAARALADAGASVEEVRPPGMEQCHELTLAMFGADGGAGLRYLLDSCGTRELHSLMQMLLLGGGGRTLSLFEFEEVMLRLDRWRREMLTFLERYDAILCPACSQPAMPHGTSIFNMAAFTYTMAYNLTGWPGAVVRGGTSPEGLPIGVQTVARPWREDVALALAQHLEKALGGYQRPSEISAAA